MGNFIGEYSYVRELRDLVVFSPMAATLSLHYNGEASSDDTVPILFLKPDLMDSSSMPRAFKFQRVGIPLREHSNYDKQLIDCLLVL